MTWQPNQKQTLMVPLGGGLRTDVDDKLVPVGSVLELENAQQLRTGEIVSRYGTMFLAPTLLGGGTLPQPYALASYRGALVSMSVPGPTPLAEWSPARSAWVPATSARRGPLSYSLQTVASAAMSMDVAYSNGYYFLFYRDTQPGSNNVIQTAIEAATGVRIFTRAVDGTGIGTGFRVGVANGYAVFVYFTGGNITLDSFQISALSGTPNTTAFVAGGGSTGQIDVRTQGSLLQVVYASGGNVAALDLTPSTGVVSTWSPRDPGGVVIPGALLTWVLDFGGSGKIALAATNGVYWNFATAGATRNAASFTANIFGANFQGITAWTSDASVTGNGVVLYDDRVAKTITAFAFTNGAFSAGPLVVARSVVLASKAWKYNGDIYVAAARMTTGQYTRFVLNPPAEHLQFGATPSNVPQAVIAPNDGTQSGTGLNVLPSVPSVSSNVFAFGIDIARSLDGEQANTQPITGDGIGVDLVTITHGAIPNTTLGPPREAIDNLLVPGAALGSFDGVIFGQAGFAYFPDQPTLAGAGGGAMTAGATYWYRIVYRYVDGRGRVWRSAPSVLKSIAMAANTAVNLTIPTLRLTERAVTIEYYRGAANDAVNFQFVGSVANSTTVDTVGAVDLSSDLQIAAGEELYTNGGQLQNDTLPGFSSVCIAGNRFYGVPMDDPQSVWASNLFVIGQGLRMSIFNVIDIKDQRGGITALAAMDDKVIAFKADAVYQITGDGSDTLGRGGFNVQPLAIGIGTTNPQSVVEAKDGIPFRSTSARAGQFIVDRGGSIQYIGAPVQRYLANQITGAVMVAALSQIRLYSNAGRSLVHDTVSGIWATYTGQPGGAVAATVWNGVPVFADAGGLVWAEDLTGSNYTDNGVPYTVTVTTPWLQMNGVRGFEKLRAVQGVGQRVAAHTLTITPYWNFDDSAPFTPAQNVTPGPLWDWEFRYTARMAALKLKLQFTSGNAGAKMSALAVEYYVLPGLRRLSSANRST